jgi:hypothetical protein
MKHLALAFASLALAATPDAAPAESVLLAAATPPSVIADPDWVRTPTVEELISAFPVAAIEKGASGEALIECQVRPGGALDGCFVLTETGTDILGCPGVIERQTFDASSASLVFSDQRCRQLALEAAAFGYTPRGGRNALPAGVTIGALALFAVLIAWRTGVLVG